MGKLAIITARGGSKRIPRKNIKLFLGKPIINYSIEAALQCGIFDEIMVSTDSEEIAEVARKAGAKVPFMRSAETANDFATTRDVLLEVLKKYDEFGKHFEQFACIYPTNPFITPEKLNEAWKVFENSDADSLMPVVAFSYPPQRGHLIVDGFLQMVQPEHATTRSQDLPKIYHDVGQYYFYHTDRYLQNLSANESRVLPYEISEKEAQDIDTIEDWELAEMKYKILRGCLIR